MKILIIVNSNFGIGHFVRAKNIAKSLKQLGSEIMIAHSGVIVPNKFWGYLNQTEFSEPHFWENIRDADKYVQKKEELILDHSTRSKNIIRILDDFKPNLIVYEFIPFSKFRFLPEFIYTVEYAKLNYSCKVAISVRDIIDNEIKPTDFLKFNKAVELIDLVIIHSKEKIYFDNSFIDMLEKRKIDYKYCGLLITQREVERAEIKNDKKSLFVSSGGGRDKETVNNFLRSFPNFFLNEDDYDFYYASGYFKKMKKEYNNLPLSFKVLNEDEYLSLIINSSNSLSLNMAGYNTCWENVYYEIPMIIIPRNRYEQIKRTYIIESLGVGINGKELTKNNYYRFLEEYMIKRDAINDKDIFDLHGITFSNALFELIDG